MAIPMSMTPVLDRYIRKVTAYDESASIVDYQRRAATVGEDYWFPGVSLPPSDSDLQMLEEGDIQIGTIIVYTRGKELFFTDIQDPTASVMQSFVRHDGKVYRVKSEMNRMEDGLYRKYIAVKYLIRKEKTE